MHFLEFLTLSQEGSSWWNYPGFELWKFVNLTVFVTAAIYLHGRFGRPLAEALRARKEVIKRELKNALDERDRALTKLAEVEARLQGLDGEAASLREQAKLEAEAERERIKRSTETEMAKLRLQAQREIESATKLAKQELRRFAAERSVTIAAEAVRRDIRPEDDTRLIGLNLEQIGRGSH